ncbi:MAG TPA: NAD(P)H-hydrate epimerase, partial [Nevskiaceae bacterium]|nr:NAD(P)H-hydrate epimerase [Nevskiaceae bacterium]
MQDIGRLYEVAAVRELDRRFIQGAGIPGLDLMRRAAAVCWRELQQRWPEVQRIVVLCGGGNNGGDGYEIACLARAAGCEVSVVDFATRAPAGDAARARQAWL